uniref:Uncharacterized protein n=1 Tax=viral metagenome TaxID=1070528 RepID=A0A6C0HJ51_9ZZZZ
MANLPGLKNVCTPAFVYFVLSIATIFVMLAQNLGNPNSYCIGRYSCNVADINLLFALKFIYVIFWTWILNLICREGFEGISWVLVILPYILMFVFILTLFIPK